MLSEHLVPRDSVQTAGRRKDEALDAGLFGQSREANGADVVDVVRTIRIDIAKRIIRQGRQMHDRVEPFEVGCLYGTKVHSPLVWFAAIRAKRSAFEQKSVESDYLVSGG